MPRRLAGKTQRRGMSLAELLISLTILALLAGTIATMAMAVQSTGDYARGRGDAVQHARVVIDRIDRLISTATVTESFPGFLVLAWSQSSGSYPDTLVLWKPDTGDAIAGELPQANELVIIRPDPANPRQLLEITNRHLPDGAVITYPANEGAQWRALVEALTARSDASKGVLTEMLRIAPTGDSSGAATRAAIRFRISAMPSDAEIDAYRAIPAANAAAKAAYWQALPWPQQWSGRNVGLQSRACFVELQLAATPDASAAEVLPFFGSSSLWTEVKR